MAEDQAEPTYEEFLGMLLDARAEGRLTDDLVRQIAVMLEQGMPSIPPPSDGVGDAARIQLVLLAARADKRGQLTADVKGKISALIAGPQPTRLPTTLPAQVGERERGSEDVEDEETPADERGPDTDPPAPSDEDG